MQVFVPETLALPMKVVLTARSRGAVAVERGPLVYALKITHVWKKLQERFPAFPDWECRPGSAWNYAICLALEKGAAPQAPVVIAKDPPASSYFRVTHPRMPADSSPWESSPIELTCKARKVNGWKLLENEVTPDVPQSPVTTDSPEEQITLVPYGCTRIRITHFPVTPGCVSNGLGGYHFSGPVETSPKFVCFGEVVPVPVRSGFFARIILTTSSLHSNNL